MELPSSTEQHGGLLVPRVRSSKSRSATATAPSSARHRAASPWSPCSRLISSAFVQSSSAHSCSRPGAARTSPRRSALPHGAAARPRPHRLRRKPRAPRRTGRARARTSAAPRQPHERSRRRSAAGERERRAQVVGLELLDRSFPRARARRRRGSPPTPSRRPGCSARDARRRAPRPRRARSAASSAYSRIVSSSVNRSPRRRTRLASTSAASGSHRILRPRPPRGRRARSRRRTRRARRGASARPRRGARSSSRASRAASLARRQVAGAADEHVERIVEPLFERRHRQNADARSGELDRERQPVEPSADPGDDRRRLIVTANSESTAAARAAKSATDSLDRQWRHRVLVLAAHPQRHARGREHTKPRRAREQPGEKRRRLGRNLLEVVEDE